MATPGHAADAEGLGAMSEKERQAVAKKRVLPPTFLLLSVVAMVGLHFLLPWRQIMQFPWTLFGTAPFLAGVVLNLLADRALKKHGTTVKPFEESSSLVTGGVYGISRHPMYLGFVLVMLGIAVFMGSATPYAVVILLGILMEMIFVRVEERMMAEKFGEAWSEYTARVRRWV